MTVVEFRRMALALPRALAVAWSITAPKTLARQLVIPPL
jgi:hypothetical protein